MTTPENKNKVENKVGKEEEKVVGQEEAQEKKVQEKNKSSKPVVEKATTPVPVVPKKKPKRVKEKGNKFQLLIAKRLSKWATGQEKPIAIWSSSGSGSQATVTKDFTSKMAGDLMPVHEDVLWLFDRFVFECKNRLDTDVLDLITPNKDRLLSWWDKIDDIATAAGKQPMLIFHRPQSKYDYVCISLSLNRILFDKLKEVPAIHTDDVVVYRLDDFLEVITPSALKACIRVKKEKKVEKKKRVRLSFD